MSYTNTTNNLKLPIWLDGDVPSFSPDVAEAFEKIDDFANEVKGKEGQTDELIKALQQKDLNHDELIKTLDNIQTEHGERITQNEAEIGQLKVVDQKLEQDFNILDDRVDGIEDVEIPGIKERVDNTEQTADTALENANTALKKHTFVEYSDLMWTEPTHQALTSKINFSIEMLPDELDSLSEPLKNDAKIALFLQLQFDTVNNNLSGSGYGAVPFSVNCKTFIPIKKSDILDHVPDFDGDADSSLLLTKKNEFLKGSTALDSNSYMAVSKVTFGTEEKIAGTDLYKRDATVIPHRELTKYEEAWLYIDENAEGDDYVRFCFKTSPRMGGTHTHIETIGVRLIKISTK